jgi:hypothetical protein
MLSILAMPLVAQEPISVAIGNGVARPQQPQLALDDKGTIHITFGAAGRALYAAIPSGKSTSIAAKPLPDSGVMSLGMRRGPRISATKSGVCVTLIAGELGKGKDGDIVAYSSTDEGANWANRVLVNERSGSAREGLHAMASSADGTLACAWLDLRNDKSEVMVALSTDGGATWSANALVYQSPDGDVCPCCHPSVAFGKDGAIHVMWRNALDGARDMYVASSTDGGRTFQQAKKLGAGTWKLDKCPMDGGMICADIGNDADAALHSVWRRDTQLFLCESGKPEQFLGAGEQPWIASTLRGPAVVWIGKRGGALYLQKPGDKQPTKLDESAADPVIASSPNGKSYAVAWERREGEKTSILVQRFETK